MPKAITKEQHLQALGLFTLAVQHACEADKAREGLKRLLGATGPLGCIDDAIFDSDRQKPHHLDDALREEGYIIADA